MRHLQSFKYVKIIAESGSIRSAAESCAISPSALNRHIQTLELDLDIQIFDRVSKGVRLSTEGELFYQFALRQLAGFDRLKAQIDDIKGLRTGAVRVGISADLSPKFIQAQIAEYQNEHPEVHFELKVVSQDVLEDELTSNQLDIALFYQPMLGRGLNVIHATQVNVHVALPNGVPLDGKDEVKLYEIMDQSALLPAQNTHLRAKVDGASERLGLTLRARMECSDALPFLAATKRSLVSFCLPFREDFEAYQRCGYKLIPVASKDIPSGFVSLITATHSTMAIAPQKFAEKIVARLEENKV